VITCLKFLHHTIKGVVDGDKGWKWKSCLLEMNANNSDSQTQNRKIKFSHQLKLTNTKHERKATDLEHSNGKFETQNTEIFGFKVEKQSS
jgi:uncharacterized membrane protein YcgQ (UPF0703/DUF1980 family)